jgi:HD-GYP domain-containing protein (c-di-GMP phosphodiesterase class II)
MTTSGYNRTFHVVAALTSYMDPLEAIGYPRTQEEDLAWAAKRAAVSIGAAAIQAGDGDLGMHCDDVMYLCDAIAEELGVHGVEWAAVLATAQLHDIGKVAVPRAVLDKPGPLEIDEWVIVQDHTVVGERIVQSVPELVEVSRLVRHSHERWDGTGYPDGLSGTDIPLASRIVLCADSFQAIRSDRPYCRGRSTRTALKEMKRNAGSQFDPDVVDALLRVAGRIRGSLPETATTSEPSRRSRRLAALFARSRYFGPGSRNQT